MSRAAYAKRTCRCGVEVSVAGCAWAAHMKAHVRKGEVEVAGAKYKGQPWTYYIWKTQFPARSRQGDQNA